MLEYTIRYAVYIIPENFATQTRYNNEHMSMILSGNIPRVINNCPDGSVKSPLLLAQLFKYRYNDTSGES